MVCINNCYIFSGFFMFNLDRRRFFHKIVNFGTFFSLAAISGDIIFRETKMNFISKQFFLMGTKGKIQMFIEDNILGGVIINNVINKLELIESFFTKFSPDSFIGKINCNSFNYHEVPNDVISILDIGKNISILTDNYFDMGMGNFLSYTGIDKNVPMVGCLTKSIDFDSELVDISGNYVKLHRKNVMLDLGGIGKGYALDIAIDMFINYGVKHVIIELGGDIRAHGGMPLDLSWKIDIDNRLFFLFEKSKSIEIISGSFAASGGYLKRSLVNNCFIKHHIIDPIDLVSRDYYFLVTVKGVLSSICDALSTSCYNIPYSSLDIVKKRFGDYNIDVYF